VDRVVLNRLLAIASAQNCLITGEQAASAGATPAMMGAAVDRGWFRRERRGVFVLAGAPPSRWRPVVAAVLAGGPDVVVSHTTAAAVHHFYGIHADEIELMVPRALRRHLEGVRIHRSATLQPSDVERRNGVAVTSPVRTVIDLAGRFEQPLLGKILDEGAIARLWTAERILARMDDSQRGVAGAADLRVLLAERLGEGNPDSPLERRVVRVLKRVAPGYALHHRVVLDGEVIEMDIAWVDQKIDGEVDGMAVRNGSRNKFERQCRRGNILAAHGWSIVHFTDKMDDRTLIAQVAPLLGLSQL
jgi:hypothetical protein